MFSSPPIWSKLCTYPFYQYFTILLNTFIITCKQFTHLKLIQSPFLIIAPCFHGFCPVSVPKSVPSKIDKVPRDIKQLNTVVVSSMSSYSSSGPVLFIFIALQLRVLLIAVPISSKE